LTYARSFDVTSSRPPWNSTGRVAGANASTWRHVLFVAREAPIVSSNVQCLPTAREPTARAAKGCPPPFTRDRQPHLRWQGAKRQRGKRMLADVGALDQRDPLKPRHPGETETLRSGRRTAAAAVDNTFVCRSRPFPPTFCVCRRPESRPQGGEGLSTALPTRRLSPPAVARRAAPPRQTRVR
jgi:hypothetical protein